MKACFIAFFTYLLTLPRHCCKYTLDIHQLSYYNCQQHLDQYFHYNHKSCTLSLVPRLHLDLQNIHPHKTHIEDQHTPLDILNKRFDPATGYKLLDLDMDKACNPLPFLVKSFHKTLWHTARSCLLPCCADKYIVHFQGHKCQRGHNRHKVRI